MPITNDHVTGFLVGLGVAAAGYYAYSRNKPRIDAFLRQQGIRIPESPTVDAAKLSFEQLVAEKERLEDLIAEREHETAQAEQAAAPK
jgi:hypothetical protein